MNEQLEFVGVSSSALDEEGVLALKFIAQAASILGTRSANEEDLLLRWTDLVIQDFESVEQNVCGTHYHHASSAVYDGSHKVHFTGGY